MREKKNLIALVLCGLVVIGCTVFAITRPNSTDEQGSSEASSTEDYGPPRFAIYDQENSNPKDYSNLEEGSVFYDEFWHGMVTIIGSPPDLVYNEVVENARGRIIASQDGKWIYVEQDENAVQEIIDPNNACPDDNDIGPVQSDELDAPTDPEAEEYYKRPRIGFESMKPIANGSSNIFPGFGWKSVRLVTKQYLTDIGYPDVKMLRIVDNSATYAEALHGFKCTADGMPGEIGIYLDFDNGLWQFNYSEINDEDSYMAYDPVDFVMTREQNEVKEWVNKVVGYEKYDLSESADSKKSE